MHYTRKTLLITTGAFLIIISLLLFATVVPLQQTVGHPLDYGAELCGSDHQPSITKYHFLSSHQRRQFMVDSESMMPGPAPKGFECNTQIERLYL